MQELITLSETAATTAVETHNAGADALLGLGVFGLGLGIVFVGLVSLIFITWLYPRILKAILPSEEAKERKAVKKADSLLKQKESKTETGRTAVAEASVKTNSTVLSAVSEETAPALIAVITAAIAASLGTSTNGIVIKSLRRSRPSLPAWGTNARIEQISNRL